MPTKKSSVPNVTINKQQVYTIFSEIIRTGYVLELWNFYNRYSSILLPKKKGFLSFFRKQPPDFIRQAMYCNYPYMIQELTEMGFYSHTNVIGDLLDIRAQMEKRKKLEILLNIGYIYIENKSDLKRQKNQVMKYMNICDVLYRHHRIRS